MDITQADMVKEYAAVLAAQTKAARETAQKLVEAAVQLVGVSNSQILAALPAICYELQSALSAAEAAVPGVTGTIDEYIGSV
jgi:hypothetical protein